MTTIQELRAKGIKSIDDLVGRPALKRNYEAIEDELPEEVRGLVEGEVTRGYKLPVLLHHLYHVEGMSTHQVADVFGYSRRNVYRMLKNLGIPVRNRSEVKRGRRHSEETRKRMSEAKQDYNPWDHFADPEKARKRMSEAKSGKMHPMYGRRHSEKTRKRMSEAKRGGRNPKYVDYDELMINLGLADDLSEFCEANYHGRRGDITRMQKQIEPSGVKVSYNTIYDKVKEWRNRKRSLQ